MVQINSERTSRLRSNYAHGEGATANSSSTPTFSRSLTLVSWNTAFNRGPVDEATHTACQAQEKVNLFSDVMHPISILGFL